MDRWARQVSLREVGAAGQARIAGTVVAVPLAQPLTAELLVRAGAGVRVASGHAAPGADEDGGSTPDQHPAEPAFAHAALFHHEAPRDVAAQAAAALAHLRRALGVAS